jgi:uncharacterized protein
VNDYAGLLAPTDRDRLERVLAEGERATGAQVAIAVFRSLEGQSLEDFSIRLGQQWRIGHKGLDNGAILVVFVDDRKVRLEVGYGLEPVVTDALSARIIREDLAPRFREGRYAAGLEAAARAVFDRVGGRERPAERRRQEPSGAPPWAVLGFAGVVAVIAFILAREVRSGRRFARRNIYSAGRDGWSTPVAPPGWWGGGGGGGGSGGFSGGGGGFGGGGASGSW